MAFFDVDQPQVSFPLRMVCSKNAGVILRCIHVNRKTMEGVGATQAHWSGCVQKVVGLTL